MTTTAPKAPATAASPAPPPNPPRRPLAPARVQLGFAGLLAATSRPAARPSEALPLGASPPGSHAMSVTPKPVRPKADEDAPKDGRGPNDELLDPLYRQGALLVPTAPPLAAPASPPVATTPVAQAPSLEELVPQLVRKLALAGDGRRATVRVELGSGPLAGATVLVSNESGAIRVDVEAPSGLGAADRAAWSARLRSRLEARGLAVESVAIA